MGIYQRLRSVWVDLEHDEDLLHISLRLHAHHTLQLVLHVECHKPGRDDETTHVVNAARHLAQLYLQFIHHHQVHAIGIASRNRAPTVQSRSQATRHAVLVPLLQILVTTWNFPPLHSRQLPPQGRIHYRSERSSEIV